MGRKVLVAHRPKTDPVASEKTPDLPVHRPDNPQQSVPRFQMGPEKPRFGTLPMHGGIPPGPGHPGQIPGIQKVRLFLRLDHRLGFPGIDDDHGMSHSLQNPTHPFGQGTGLHDTPETPLIFQENPEIHFFRGNHRFPDHLSRFVHDAEGRHLPCEIDSKVQHLHPPV